MFGRKKLDAVIVGAGPVGLFAALVLAKRRNAHSDRGQGVAHGAHSYALALHHHSLRLMEGVGLLPSILDKGYLVDRIGLYEGSERKAEIRVTKNGNAIPHLVVLRQDVLESLLVDALAECGVHVLWNHRAAKLVLHSDKVVVTIDKLEQESVGYSIAQHPNGSCRNPSDAKHRLWSAPTVAIRSFDEPRELNFR